MGAFFTNLQVYGKNECKEALKNEIIKSIRNFVLDDDFQEVEEGEEADRTIVVGPVGKEPWIAVYDEGTEYGDIGLLNLLSATLSSKLNKAVVNITVCDSDALCMNLFNGEVLVDEYSNMPDYFMEEEDSEEWDTEEWIDKLDETAKGNAELWSDVIGEGYTCKDLSEAWSGEKVFVEDILVDIVKILNMNEKQSLTGYNYLEDNNIEDLTILKFKEKQIPKEVSKELGLTKFNVECYSNVIEKKVGEEANLSIDICNQGQPSKGVQIIIWGQAIQDNLVKLVHSKLKRVENGNVIAEAEGELFETTSDNIGKIVVLNFKDFEIPMGFNGGLPQNMKYFSEYLQKRMEAGFKVEIGMETMAVGKSKFTVSYIPFENPKEGQTTHCVEVNIKL